MAKRSVRGSLILFVGNFLSTAISAVTSILIARLLGPEQYGLYSLALVIPSLLQLFVGFGVNTSVTRYSAYSLSIGKPDEARRFTENAIVFLLLIGLAFTLLNFISAGVLSSLLLHRPGLGPYVQLISLAMLGNTLFQAATASAIGWNRMGLTGSSQIVQAVVKLALSPLLIILGFGVFGALVGYIASYIMAGTVAVLILYLFELRGHLKVSNFKSDIREMMKYGLPVFAGSLLSGLATYYASIILATIASNTVYGYYSAASNLTTPIGLVSSATVGALFPTFAAIDGVRGDARAVFRHTYKFVAFLLTPVVLFLIASSPVLIRVFYGASFSGGTPYLVLLAAANIPVAVGYNVHPAFFNGFNRTRLTMYLGIAAGITLAVLAPLLSIEYGLGVDGLIYAIFASYFVGWAAGVAFAFRSMGATMDVRRIGTILLISIVSAACTYLFPKVPFSNVLTLLVYIVVFFGVYLTLAPLTRAISRWDADTLEATFRDLRVIGRVASPIFRYERFLMQKTSREEIT